MTFFRNIIIALAFLGVGACANMSDVRHDYAHGAGVSRVYKVPLPHLMRVAQRAAHNNGADLVELNAEEMTMYASFPPAGIATASYVGVWFTPTENPAETKVTVVSRRHRSLSIVTRVSEYEFLDAVSKELTK